MFLGRRLLGTEEDKNTKEKEPDGGYDSGSDVYDFLEHGCPVRVEKTPAQKSRDM
jgi:hypothetical protein